MDRAHPTHRGELVPERGPTASGAASDVVVLRWPDATDARTQLVIDQVPRHPSPDAAAALVGWDRRDRRTGSPTGRDGDPARPRDPVATGTRPVRPPTPVLDSRGDLVGADGARVRVPAVERRILALLLERRDKVVSRPALCQAAWPDEPAAGSALGSRISTLRRRVERHGLAIHTVRGHGYMLEVHDVRPSERPHEHPAARPAS